jgi:hypothetical protein
MPLSWTVSHPHRLVHATASGAVSLADLRRFIEDVRDGGLRPYAKQSALEIGLLYDQRSAGSNRALAIFAATRRWRG